jgi:aryl-alcohol dehydrogenase-like predicted oxidoreductase
MKKKNLGNSDIKVAPLMFGGNPFGWTIDEKTSFQILDAFVGAGFDFIDTADVYSAWVPGNKGGESEVILGNWMKSRKNRDKVILATKLGHEAMPGRKGLSKKNMHLAVEDSLRRLQTDYIDLYQSHRDDLSVPMEETLEGYSELIRAGKVRVIGASNFTAPRLSEALKTSESKKLPRYESLQPLYNLYDRKDYEAELEAVCVNNNLGVIPYFSLGSGFLTGKYRATADLAKYPRGSRVEKYMNDRGMKILKALDEVSAEKHCTVAQVALAWLMARPSITAPIASASTVEQLHVLTGATHVQLDNAAMKILNNASDLSYFRKS